MSKKKKRAPANPKEPQAKRPNGSAGSPNSRRTWLFVAAAVMIVAAIFALSRGNSSTTASATEPTPEEAKYLGRYLPAGFTVPTVAAPGRVTADTGMSPVTAETTDAGLAVPVSELTARRNISFNYQRTDGQTVPMIAYVKDSGEVFVGVSYCVPCKGEGQTLTTDGALTCDSCGTKRDLESGVGLSGSCKLYPLDEIPSKIEGDKLVIDKTVLDTWIVQPLDRQVG